MSDKKSKEKDKEGKKGKIKKKVDSITAVNFKVNDCPLNVFKRFKAYCQENTKDNYSFGIQRLLDIAEANLKEEMMWAKIMELEDKITSLSGEESKKERPELPTFGKTKKKKEDE